MTIQHRTLGANGIQMHVAECGQGPLVVLCHGWPELWYSWRYQLEALAAAGYRVVAPDMRGYGKTDAPASVDAYSTFDLVGDLVGLLAALGAERATLVGHDWGAAVVWQAALLRPDLFPAVAALSIPMRARARGAPLTLLRQAGLEGYYWLYFQEPGVAERHFERDIPLTFRSLLFTASGDGPLDRKSWVVPPGQGLLDVMSVPAVLPSWLSPQDIAVYASEFARTGFRGGLNWYRNIDRNWQLSAALEGVKLEQPALFIAGTREPVLEGRRGERSLEEMRKALPQLEEVRIEGAGHWLQQERPDEVNRALISFLQRVSPV